MDLIESRLIFASTKTTKKEGRSANRARRVRRRGGMVVSSLVVIVRGGARLAATLCAALCWLGSASAAEYTGTVAMLEVWSNGNVAFSLSVAAPTCNQQFVLNKSNPGTKNLYAALLAAKHTGRPIRVITEASCGPAEGYGGSYNLPIYVYALD
jgi:hypothetical protein